MRALTGRPRDDGGCLRKNSTEDVAALRFLAQRHEDDVVQIAAEGFLIVASD